MKCTKFIAVAVAAIISGGVLSIALPDNLSAQEKKVVKAVAVKKAVAV